MERVRNGVLLRALAALLAAGFAAGIEAQRGTTERVSVDSFGREGNWWSFRASLSADARFVAFVSGASNLVPNDTNATYDVFVRDRQAGKTTRVSVSSTGKQGEDLSMFPSISADGRFVAFESVASNLVPSDTNATYDVFVHDRQTGQTTRVSVSSSGQQGNGYSYRPSISADGRLVAFESDASNLVPNDTNGRDDVFVHDLDTGQTTRVSVSSSGGQGNHWSIGASISADGQFVAFQSLAFNLVPNDSNAVWDVFVHDRQTGQTTRVSVSSSGEQGYFSSFHASTSADGRFVAFTSSSPNLAPRSELRTIENWSQVFVHDRHTGQTTRVSVTSSGQEGNRDSAVSAISADGRFVAFQSRAFNLVSNDTNETWDVFVHDRLTGRTARVSLSSTGQEAMGRSVIPCISADGRFVGFESDAPNLVPNDTNGGWDAFVHQYGSGDGWFAGTIVALCRR